MARYFGINPLSVKYLKKYALTAKIAGVARAKMIAK
jgi:hypothetical protein